MSDRPPLRSRIAVTLLLTASLCLVLLVPSVPPVKAQHREQYSVTQGDQCMNVTPIGNGSESVKKFYDYRNPNTTKASNNYASYGTRRYQKDQVSTLFLYNGKNGTSLVFVHDKLDANSTNASTISMNITGLPSGSWAVKDDWYEHGHQDDNWGKWGISASPGWQGEWGTTSVSPHEIDWMWGPGRGDGGAYIGLQTMSANDSIHIKPGFNANARYWGKWQFSGNASNRMKEWRLMSAGGSNRSLDMNQSLTIQPGSCAMHEVLSGGHNSSSGANSTSSGPNNSTPGNRSGGVSNTSNGHNPNASTTSTSTTSNGTSATSGGGSKNSSGTPTSKSNSTSKAANGSGGSQNTHSRLTWANVPGFTTLSALTALVLAVVGALIASRR